jgi:NosR/NirI family transcriptional regulator, nitrous oxide reductase regulator
VADRKRPGLRILCCVFLLGFAAVTAKSQDRVPRPEFETGYEVPQLSVPEARSNTLEILDVVVFIGALAASAFLAIKLRKRTAIYWLTVFSVAYLGFFRKGCICPVGATQNVILALFQPGYIIPVSAVIFFVLPLVSALFFGRTFCSSVCPLGAVQELVIYKPLKVPQWIARPLGFVPVLYLGFTALFAATGSEFIICRFDPFVSLFRFGGSFEILLLGAVFILTGIFVARPYCRFFCPYGLILSWMSRLSWRHTTITPDECIQCSLCKDACPVGAIELPSPSTPDSDRTTDRRKLVIILIAAPLIIGGGAMLGRALHGTLSMMHPTVKTAEQVLLEETGVVEEHTLLSETFRASRKTTTQLFGDAEIIVDQFRVGSPILGASVGALFCLYLIGLYRRERNSDYRPNRGNCISCGRCFSYCPQEHVRRRSAGSRSRRSVG